MASRREKEKEGWSERNKRKTNIEGEHENTGTRSTDEFLQNSNTTLSKPSFFALTFSLRSAEVQFDNCYA